MLTTFENGQKLQIQFYKNLWYRNRLFGITVRAEILFALSMNTFVVLVLIYKGAYSALTALTYSYSGNSMKTKSYFSRRLRRQIKWNSSWSGRQESAIRSGAFARFRTATLT